MKQIIAAAALMVAQSAVAGPAADPTCCQVIELRQYITYPGKRDTLFTLFEREFIESQEALGIRVLGQFRDLNDPHRFTWIRGFSDMAARKQALTDFYYGALWKRWKADANATLYDNDDVLLLRPAGPGTGFAPAASARPPIGASAPRPGLIVATIYHFSQEVSAQFGTSFGTTLAPLFEQAGATIIGRFVSDKSPNTFAQLPVREQANVFVWIARFDDRAAYDRYHTRMAQDVRWRDQQFAPLYKRLARAPEVLILEPSARSLIY
ncbi:MAG: NIPSNAP family containing protein [Pseudomonadota bacterium]